MPTPGILIRPTDDLGPLLVACSADRLYVGSMLDLPIRAMLVDCDGTLAPERMEVSPVVRRAVTSLAQRMPVGIVSSRDHHDVGWLAADLGFTAPQVSEGGARVFRTGEHVPLWIRTLAADDAHSIVQFLDERGHTFSAVDGDRRISTSAEIRDWQLTRVTANSLESQQAELIASGFGGSMAGVHTEIVVRTDNGDWMVDFTHEEATKASGAAEFARWVGVPLRQVVGVGDGYNDLSLLRACGSAVAMGHAPPSIKAAADYVAPTAWEDGLAAAINEFIEPRLA